MSRQVKFVVRSSEDFGRAIAELRRLRGETQEQTASSMGLSRSYLAQMERGRLPRTVELVLGLLRRAGATVTVTAEVDDGET